MLACGSVLRANHWAKPRISSRATKASQLVSKPSLLWMAQGSTARIEKGVPHHCSSKLTLSRSCYRQHEDFSYAPSSSFYFLLLLHPPLYGSFPSSTAPSSPRCAISPTFSQSTSPKPPFWPATSHVGSLELVEVQGNGTSVKGPDLHLIFRSPPQIFKKSQLGCSPPEKSYFHTR